MNVAFGGTLNQNIGGHMGVWHSAHVVAGGWLSGVYSGSVSVLSYHHQSIRDLAPGFQVDMRAGDGTVEAISNSAKRVYGVQFHPEQMNNDAGNRCMKQLVAICSNYWENEIDQRKNRQERSGKMDFFCLFLIIMLHSTNRLQ